MVEVLVNCRIGSRSFIIISSLLLNPSLSIGSVSVITMMSSIRTIVVAPCSIIHSSMLLIPFFSCSFSMSLLFSISYSLLVTLFLLFTGKNFFLFPPLESLINLLLAFSGPIFPISRVLSFEHFLPWRGSYISWWIGSFNFFPYILLLLFDRFLSAQTCLFFVSTFLGGSIFGCWWRNEWCQHISAWL